MPSFAVVAAWSLITLSAAPITKCDFEKGATGWTQPGGESGVVAEPGAPANHAYQVVATKPHHTHLILANSGQWPDFIASLRVKVLSHQGEPPVVYVYGRQGGAGFRALCLRPDQASAMCYHGQDKPSVQFGKVAVSGGERWVWMKLACYKNHLAAKAWIDGAREPRWQIKGEAEGEAAGRFALGVWTSPRTPSSARVLFDDVTFQPLVEADLAALGLRFAPREALDPKALAIEDGVFTTADQIGLATASTLVAFDRKTGQLTHIVDRTSGRDFVASQSDRSLFSLALTQPDAQKSQEIAADDFARVAVKQAGSGKLEFEFSSHDTLPLRVRATAAAGDDGLVRMRIGVVQVRDWAVGQIAFPRFSAPGVLGDKVDDDRLLTPFSDGALFEAPGSRSQSRDTKYPGLAFAQFMAYYDPTAGLYLAIEDPDGHCKSLGMRSAKDRLVEMPFAHLLPEVVGQDAVLPYDVALGTFVGDWCDAASLYKRWACKQPWCAKTLAQRDDIPKFLLEGSSVMVFGIQNEKGYNGFFGPNLEQLPEVAAAYRKRAGLAHLIVVPYGWENRGTWVGIHYLPAVPSNETWQKANAALRAQGDRTAMLTSGFWWVVKRQKTHGGPAFDDSADFQKRQEMAVHRNDGKPFLVDSYDKVGVHGDWRGLSATLCHGSAAARQTMLEIFLDVARLGTPLVSFDQEIGGCQHAPCYSPTHGHPPGYGIWMWTGFRDVCRDILRQGKPIEPELGLFMENCSELAIPYAATYWSRQFGEIDQAGVGSRGVGLFSYLYHEYVTAIGAACVQGQGLLGTQPSAELRCCVLANNLTRGLIPGPFAQDVRLEPNDAWHKMVADAYFSFCQPYARFPEYLLRGAACRPPEIGCAEQEVWFYRQDAAGEPLKAGGPKVSRATLRLPTVTAGSFVAPDGTLGTVIVNRTATAQDAVVRCEGSRRSAALYRADRTLVQKYDPLPAEIRLKLEPFGVRMLIGE